MHHFAVLLVLVLVQCLFLASATEASVYVGPFADSYSWVKDSKQLVDREKRIKFTVALQLQNVDEMKREFLKVSMPESPMYGQFYTLSELSSRFSLPRVDRETVVSFFESIHGAIVHGLNHHGDFLTVEASIGAIEERLNTKLSYRKHKQGLSSKRAIRADAALDIPEAIRNLISFVSLNGPITHVVPRAGTSLKSQKETLQTGKTISKQHSEDKSKFGKVNTTATIGVTSGNEEALISFVPVCGDGSINVASPPCSNLAAAAVPQFTVHVTAHANNISNPYLLNTDPFEFKLKPSHIYCYSILTNRKCDNTKNCTCLAKIGPLPKYQQLQATVSYNFDHDAFELNAHKAIVLGTSSFFALTDVATASLLSDLYHIPQGMAAKHGSNQSVVEFYSEFYSNDDLLKFFALSGLPPATIPSTNVLGDLPNDESHPGGEAQLDVEYIMALAPGADTYFYSFSDLNPNDPENEGFLAYLTFVSSESNPPLVHSLSYGDVEASIFTDEDRSYGDRCDMEFLKLGLRGISVVFSSGDDGIGNFIIRDDPATACSQAFPAWPASSPYVTSVGATQLTNNYLPACGQPYSLSSSFGQVPSVDQLLFQCTGTKETVCSATIGGVITSGGGFSDVHERSSSAPWQEAAVNEYLQQHSNSVPPLSYFNALGRGYPDVATYGSNYFVYLGGKITRESGTSASAPVFAAMITLWNDMRMASGRSPMGFIAPFLYAAHASHPSSFQDITTGDNACGAGHSISDVNCCVHSFGAAPGWDAVTGLGSPNFEVLAKLVLSPHPRNESVIRDFGVFSVETNAVEGINEMYDGVESGSGSHSDTTASLAIAAVVLGCFSTVIAIVGVYLSLRSNKNDFKYSSLTSSQDPHFKLSSASNFLLNEST